MTANGKALLSVAEIEKQKIELCKKVYLKYHSRIRKVSRHCSNAVLAAGLVGIVIKKAF